MSYRKPIVAVLIWIALPTTLAAQSPDLSLLTLEGIFASGEFFPQFFGPARWLADGSGYTTLEWTRGRSGRELVRYDPESGTRKVVVSLAQLTPGPGSQPLHVADYACSADAAKLLIFSNTQRL